MDIDDLINDLKAKAAKTAEEHKLLKLKVSGEVLRFVDDNFRNQAWEGKPWHKIDRDGTILVDSGALRRSVNIDNSTPGDIRLYSNLEYAVVHNEGLEATVSVKEHTRSKYKLKKGKGKKVSSTTVKAHQRKMNVKQRQFAPTQGSESPTLDKSITTIIETHLKTILKP